jgi:hypothetical protein
MKLNKKVKMGEYVITLEYNDANGNLEINVLDELDEVIENIIISNEDDDDGFYDDNNEPNGFNLN